jgi:hypothetical protein
VSLRGIVIGLLIAAIACEPDPRPATNIAVVDSSGIPVVINPPPESDTVPPRRTSDTPMASVGSINGEASYSLYEVSGGALLSDGRFVLANTGTHELRFYDSVGTHLRTVGGEGAGPGKFRLLNWGGIFDGDSILTVDGLLRRATVFDSSGSYARSFTLPDEVSATLSEPLGVLSQGGILFTPTAHDSRPPGARWTATGIERHPRHAVVVGPDGRVDTVNARLPGDEWYRNVEDRSMVRVPLGRRLHGSAAGGRIALGSNESFRIHIYDQSNQLLTVIIQAVTEREVTDEDYWAAADDEVFADLTMPGARASARRVLEELPRPVTWPRYLGFRLDRRGHLWVRESVEMGGEADLWSMFDLEGRVAARLKVPEGFEILDIRETRILGLIKDEMGVERAVIYRIVEPPVADRRGK